MSFLRTKYLFCWVTAFLFTLASCSSSRKIEKDIEYEYTYRSYDSIITSKWERLTPSQLEMEFEKRKGSYVCRDILGCDLRTEEGKSFALSNGLFRTLCPEMVRTAAEILTEMLEGEV